jgi:antirestriction protein ArdC
MLRPETQTEIAMRNEIYQKITDNIISKLEKGVVPWQKPWHDNGMMPMNIKGRVYRGINPLLLGSTDYQSPFWLTFKQAKELGGNIRKGEESTIVVFWKMMHKAKTEENADGETVIKQSTFPYLRYYCVFNLEQTENIPLAKIPKIEKPPEIEFSPVRRAEKLLAEWEDKPTIKHGGSRACYYPAFDRVEMPEQKFFKSSEEYYSTLFHEYVHSTGHKARTGRHAQLPNHKFGSKDYSIEELVAEMGATFLCAIAGIENKIIDNSAAYIQSWINKLKNDNTFLTKAASLAQKACDYIAPPDFAEKDESIAA